MSSHREAPVISRDPVADSTDLYAFVSPDRPGTVTLIANYVPLQEPAGGPGFHEFGDDVLYQIHIDNSGDGHPDISYQFAFRTELRDPGTAGYHTGPITSLGSENWNRRQFYSLTKVEHGRTTAAGRDFACPPCNLGPLFTPGYDTLAAQAVHDLPGGGRVFAGQRAAGFQADLGSIFDLADLRPLEELRNQLGLHVFTPGQNVHSIALQLPVSELTQHGTGRVDDPRSVIGVWTTASRQKVRLWDYPQGEKDSTGPYRQVSRLGNPLFNEVINPVGKKDLWNTLPPSDDKLFAGGVVHPELATLLPVLYPGVFPQLDRLARSGAVRADLEAILLTGIGEGVIEGFQNRTGDVKADMLRLNTAIKPAQRPHALGLLAGDLAGFPNGRRVCDDVATIELRAIAGATYPLIDPGYRPDAAVKASTVKASAVKASAVKASTARATADTVKVKASVPSGTGACALDAFPYLRAPHSRLRD